MCLVNYCGCLKITLLASFTRLDRLEVLLTAVFAIQTVHYQRFCCGEVEQKVQVTSSECVLLDCDALYRQDSGTYNRDTVVQRQAPPGWNYCAATVRTAWLLLALSLY